MSEWKEITGSTMDLKKQEKGYSVIGEYKGMKEITTQLGQQYIYKFENEDGEPFQIYGFTNLNFKMEAVPVGTVIKITYKGTEKKKTKFGLKDVHQVSVMLRDDEPQEKADSPIPF